MTEFTDYSDDRWLVSNLSITDDLGRTPQLLERAAGVVLNDLEVDYVQDWTFHINRRHGQITTTIVFDRERLGKAARRQPEESGVDTLIPVASRLQEVAVEAHILAPDERGSVVQESRTTSIFGRSAPDLISSAASLIRLVGVCPSCIAFANDPGGLVEEDGPIELQLVWAVDPVSP